MAITGGATEDCIEVDLLVIGCGMAGITAAFRAASGGASVMCIDRAPHIGGSALLSHSMMWTATTIEGFLKNCPGSDPVVAEALVRGFPEVIDWLRRANVDVGEPVSVLHGRGHPVDLVSYFDRATRAVEAAGGWVLPGKVVETLLRENRVVRGARVRDDSSLVDIRASRTVVATGGFQGHRGRLHEHLGDGIRALTHRSNLYSVGDGLRLAESAGGDVAGPMDAFYGHLIPWPLMRFGPSEFSRLIMSFSNRCILLDAQGHRFVDESLGDHRSNQATFAQPGSWACLLFDQAVRSAVAERPAIAGMEHVDKVAEAQRAGAAVIVGNSLDELAHQLQAWGMKPEDVLATVQGYNDEMTGGTPPGPIPRSQLRVPIIEPPFYAVRAVPTITFTSGGIRVDGRGRVLDRDERPIEGLYAAGVDVGGAFGRGYAGGLALAAVFGYLAAEGMGTGTGRGPQTESGVSARASQD